MDINAAILIGSTKLLEVMWVKVLVENRKDPVLMPVNLVGSQASMYDLKDFGITVSYYGQSFILDFGKDFADWSAPKFKTIQTMCLRPHYSSDIAINSMRNAAQSFMSDKFVRVEKQQTKTNFTLMALHFGLGANSIPTIHSKDDIGFVALTTDWIKLVDKPAMNKADERTANVHTLPSLMQRIEDGTFKLDPKYAAKVNSLAAKHKGI